MFDVQAVIRDLLIVLLIALPAFAPAILRIIFQLLGVD